MWWELAGLAYLARHKELSVVRLQEEKTLVYLHKNNKIKHIFGCVRRLVCGGVWAAEQEGEGGEKSRFKPGASWKNAAKRCFCRKEKLSNLINFRQTPDSLRAGTCRTRARRLARETAIAFSRSDGDCSQWGERIWTRRPIRARSWVSSPAHHLLLLFTRLLTVHWIKQQSELSSSLHWDVGHWLQLALTMGKITRATTYSYHHPKRGV